MPAWKEAGRLNKRSLKSFACLSASGTRGSHGREKASFYVGGLPPSQCHKDPKSSESSLGFGVGQKTNPFCHHHTGTASRAVAEKRFSDLLN